MTIRRFTRSTIIACFVLSGASLPALSQSRSSYGLEAGASLPQGDFKDVAGNGGYAGVIVRQKVAQWVALRADLALDRFGNTSQSSSTLLGAPSTVTISARVLSVTGQVTVGIPVDTTTIDYLPYFIGGGGFYNEHVDCKGSGCAKASVAKSYRGMNAGFGVKLPVERIDTAVEVTYHTIFDAEGGSSRSEYLRIALVLLR
jgi:hypothetical protein